MKMADVRPGMRLRSTIAGGYRPEIEVTGLSEKGFIYRIPDDMPLVNPHWSMPLLRDGWEHFGVNGEALYEPITQMETTT